MTDDNKKGGGRGGDRPPRDRTPRSSSSTPRPPYKGRDGDRPARADGDRPFRARPGGDRPSGDRPPRRDGDRPFTPRGDRPSYGDRPARSDGERPFRARPAGDRPSGDRPSGDRPPRRDGDRPFTPRGDRPSYGDRPARSDGERPFRARPSGDRPNGDRPYGDRPPRRDGDRPSTPRGERPSFGSRPPRREGVASARPRFEDRGRGEGSTGGKEWKDRGPAPRQGFKDRIAKVMARAGLCSRRDAEVWIEEGRVSVNGVVLTSPALDVTERDIILVDGNPLPKRERTRLFLYHKPRGLVTTAWDPEGRPTVFSALPQGLPRVVTVGRLDINTEGLLLLTNDGGLSRVIELPDTGWLRRYRVRAYGEITQADLDTLRDGVTIDGMHYGPVEAELEREQGDNVWLTLGLREGKNREVKKILDHFGLQVNRLIRLSFGPFQLNDLPEGAVEEIRTAVLKDQLGDALTAQAEADFDAPVFIYEEEDFHPRKRETVYREHIPGKKERGSERDTKPQETPAESEAPARPKRRHPTEPLRSVWRAVDEEPKPDTTASRGFKPRRGADAAETRMESGNRPHIRQGTVKNRKGRDVLVEKVVKTPQVEETRIVRTPRITEDRVFSSRPEQGERGDRPRRERPPGVRPARSELERPNRSRDGGRPAFGDRPAGDRPPRRDGDRPYTPRSDRPAGDRPPRRDGDRPSGSGRPPFKSGGGGRPSGGARPSGGGKPYGGRPSGGSRPPRRES